MSGRATRKNPRATLPQSVSLIAGTGGNQPVQASITPDGSFELQNVSPGRYQVRISPAIIGVQPLPVDVKDKDVNDLEFLIPYVSMVTGRVISKESDPAASITISFVGETALSEIAFRQTVPLKYASLKVIKELL